MAAMRSERATWRARPPGSRLARPEPASSSGLAHLARQAQHVERRRVGERIAVVCNQHVEVGLAQARRREPDLVVLAADPVRHDSGLGALVVEGVVVHDRERLHPAREPGRQGSDDRRVDAARQQHPDRNVRYEVLRDRARQRLLELARERLQIPFESRLSRSVVVDVAALHRGSTRLQAHAGSRSQLPDPAPERVGRGHEAEREQVLQAHGIDAAVGPGHRQQRRQLRRERPAAPLEPGDVERLLSRAVASQQHLAAAGVEQRQREHAV
jgi:hypothetical protein